MSELVVRIGSIIIFHLSKLWKAKFSSYSVIIFMARLQGKFEIDRSWKWKGIIHVRCQATICSSGRSLASVRKSFSPRPWGGLGHCVLYSTRINFTMQMIYAPSPIGVASFLLCWRLLRESGLTRSNSSTETHWFRFTVGTQTPRRTGLFVLFPVLRGLVSAAVTTGQPHWWCVIFG